MEAILHARQGKGDEKLIWRPAVSFYDHNNNLVVKDVRGVEFHADHENTSGTRDRNPLFEFRDEFRSEILEYVEHGSTENIIYFLGRRREELSTKSGVDEFVSEWAKKGVIIDV